MSSSVSVDLVDVLLLAVRGCLMAQQHVIEDNLQLDEVKAALQRDNAKSLATLSLDEQKKLAGTLAKSVEVDEKGVLDYKEGNASHDLVTSADILTQQLLVHMLKTAFPSVPFTIVGEEEEENDDETHGNVPPKVKEVLDKYSGQLSETAPYQVALEEHCKQCRTVSAETVEELRGRVGIYIDPIDATNCFVEGIWSAPMNLVGISVDGVPVAAVCNRLFDHAGQQLSALASGNGAHGLSYVWNYRADSDAEVNPFIVYNGKLMCPGSAKSTAADDELEIPSQSTEARLTCSTTTSNSYVKDTIELLSPLNRIGARGAGNKLFFLVRQSVAEQGSISATGTGTTRADLFLSPGNAIKKWDTCGPHAFLLAMGGEIYTQMGVPVDYTIVTEQANPSAGEHHSPITLTKEEVRHRNTALPDGLIASTRRWKQETARRMKWSNVVE